MAERSVVHTSAGSVEPRGRLDPAGFERAVDFRTIAPPPDLARLVEHALGDPLGRARGALRLARGDASPVRGSLCRRSGLGGAGHLPGAAGLSRRRERQDARGAACCPAPSMPCGTGRWRRCRTTSSRSRPSSRASTTPGSSGSGAQTTTQPWPRSSSSCGSEPDPRRRRPDWAALAADLGYSSQQHFITDFRRTVGLTPVQYRRAVAPVPAVPQPRTAGSGRR